MRTAANVADPVDRPERGRQGHEKTTGDAEMRHTVRFAVIPAFSKACGRRPFGRGIRSDARLRFRQTLISPAGTRRCALTRGRCGSLLLHRNGLAPSTPCRSPGAQPLKMLESRQIGQRVAFLRHPSPFRTPDGLFPDDQPALRHAPPFAPVGSASSLRRANSALSNSRISSSDTANGMRR